LPSIKYSGKFFDHVVRSTGCPHCWNQEETTTGCGIIQSGSIPYVFGNGGLSFENTKYITQYSQGEVIDVTVKTSAYHGGRFEFRIQDVGSDMDPDGTLWKDLPLLTVESFSPACTFQGCRDEPCVAAKTCANIPLGGYGSGEGNDMKIKVRLPTFTVCEHCVMQWRYVTGNSCEGGISCESDISEMFWNCIDLKITPTNPVLSPTIAPSRAEDKNRPTVIPTNHPSFKPVSMSPSLEDGGCGLVWTKCGGESWTGMYIHTYTNVYTHRYIYIYIYIYIWLYIHIYAHTYIYIY
jgi:hypothetical protein